MHHWFFLILCLLAVPPLCAAHNFYREAVPAAPGQAETAPAASSADARLLDAIQERAFRYFWERADARTGLVTDRACNLDLPGDQDDYQIASIAATGYGLAALLIGVERGWITRAQGQERALNTLNFLLHELPHKRGWFYHVCDRRTGERAWKCEISSIDTCLLVLGGLVCGQYFAAPDGAFRLKGGAPESLAADNAVSEMANALYARVDWTWMRTRNGKQPDSLLVSHGWKPERGFLPYNWDRYCEAILLYLLGLGAARDPLPPASWQAWQRPVFHMEELAQESAYNVSTYNKERQEPLATLTGGPLFLHQMAQGFYDFRDQRDSLGWDYHASARNATCMHRRFCAARAATRKTYALGFWGLNASDGAGGYKAYGLPPSAEDGTVSPSGVLAALSCAPDECLPTIHAMRQYRDGRLWGKYGFAGAFNVDKDWIDPDVIGIDLGMALAAIENHRTGLIWRLIGSLDGARRAFDRAGFHITREPEPRRLRIAPI